MDLEVEAPVDELEAVELDYDQLGDGCPEGSGLNTTCALGGNTFPGPSF